MRTLRSPFWTLLRIRWRTTVADLLSDHRCGTRLLVEARPAIAPQALAFGGAPLGRQPALPGGTAGLGGAPWPRRRGGRLGEQRGHPFRRGLTVTQLRPGLRRGHRQDPIGQPARKSPERTVTVDRRQRGGTLQVEGKLNPAVGGVYRLAARPGRPGEPPRQLLRRQGDAADSDVEAAHPGAGPAVSAPSTSGNTASARPASSSSDSNWTGCGMYSMRASGMPSNRAWATASSANGTVAMPTAGIPRRSR